MKQLPKLYDKQQDIVRRAVQENRYAFFCDMGTGKTPMTIETVRYWFRVQGGVMRTLIFCPLICLENWKRELLKWSNFPESAIGIVEGYCREKKLN